MSDQKIVHVGLVTKNSEILLTDALQEQAAYALKDMCKEKGWGAVSISITSQVFSAELAVPNDTGHADILKATKESIANSLFRKNPDLETRQKGELWERKAVVTEDPEGFDQKILQTIQWAYPGIHPSLK